VESDNEINYGGALRRLSAITEKLDSLDFANTQMRAGRDKFSQRSSLDWTPLYSSVFNSGMTSTTSPAATALAVWPFC
jgi:hypothetical protein